MEHVNIEDLQSIVSMYKEKAANLEMQILFMQAQNKNILKQLNIAEHKAEKISDELAALKSESEPKVSTSPKKTKEKK